MHLIELKIHKFLKDIAGKPYTIPQELLEKFGKETQHALKRQFEREPREFKLSMSNVGKPLCILQMEREHGSSLSDPIKFLFGDIVEDIVLFLLYASGIIVLAEQEQVSLLVGKHTLQGTLDVLLDLGRGPEVYDIKSASDFSFKSKKEQSFTDFAKSDVFGYVGQLFAYAKAKNARPGGFIFCNKSSGEVHVLEIPSDFEKLQKEALFKIEYNLDNIASPFKKQFLDKEEVFRKKITGNRILDIACSMCEFKFKCWPQLQIKPQINSDSKSPKLAYYTKINDENKEC